WGFLVRPADATTGADRHEYHANAYIRDTSAGLSGTRKARPTRRLDQEHCGDEHYHFTNGGGVVLALGQVGSDGNQASTGAGTSSIMVDRLGGGKDGFHGAATCPGSR